MAGAGALYIAYAREDAEEVGAIIHVLREAGWPLVLPAHLEPDVRAQRALEAIRAAAGVVVCWSGAAARDAQMLVEAQAAMTTGRMVLAALDHVPIMPFAPPASAASARGGLGRKPSRKVGQRLGVIDLSDWRSGATSKGRSALLEAVRERVGAPPTRAGASKDQSWRKRAIWAAAAIFVVAGGVVLGSAALRGLQSGPVEEVLARLGVIRPIDTGSGARTLDPATDDFLSGVGKAGASDARGTTAPASEALREGSLAAWRKAFEAAPKEDAAVLRRLRDGVVQQGERAGLEDRAGFAALAAAIEAEIGRLDQALWAKALASRDAASTLDGLSAYRRAFPQGERLEESWILERAERARVAEVQARLAALGFSTRDPPGQPLEDTKRAVTAFQRSNGLEPSGRIDRRLMGALGLEGAAGGDAQQLPVDGAVGARIEPPASTIAPAPVATQPLRKEAGARFRDCFVCPEMVVIPAGRFRMGDLTGKGDVDEGPVRVVTLAAPLAVGRTEVTFEEWDACVTDGACVHRPNDMGWGRGAQPVVNVSYSDAVSFVAWLARKTGKPYRLLSEAEWEYAARAGTAGDYVAEASSKDLCRFANGAGAESTYDWRNRSCADGYADRPAPVGSFAANGFGLFDMTGNVWEWTADCWHASYTDAPSDGRSWTAGCEGPNRVLRGGAFSVDAAKLRVSYRYSFPDRRMPFFGLRVARALD